jgi:UDP-glucose 4-epimerase
LKILITGSRGFVGGSVGRFAARAGHEVLGVGRATQPPRGWPGAYAQADVVHSDLSGLVREFAPDAVLHAAGTASVGASLSAPLDDLRASLLTWANLLEGVRRSGLRPLVLFPSSAAVYGDLGHQAAHEELPLAPISPYGFHKAACELLGREYAECFASRVVVCRLFSLFGPAQRRLLVWELYRQLAGAADTVWLEGTGEEVRDYLHVEDAAAAFLRLAEELNPEPAGDEERAISETQPASETEGTSPPSDSRRGAFLVANVASGERTNVLALAEQLRSLVAPHKEIRCRGRARPGDPRAWSADVSRLRELAPGWRPRPLARALAECVAAWRVESP